jgi:hypothetical protein
MTPQEAKEYYKGARKLKTYRVVTSAGAIVTEQINLPGNARFLLGVFLSATTLANTRFTLQVNSLEVIEDTPGTALIPHTSEPLENVICIPVSGNDNIQLRIFDSAAITVNVTLAYI